MKKVDEIIHEVIESLTADRIDMSPDELYHIVAEGIHKSYNYGRVHGWHEDLEKDMKGTLNHQYAFKKNLGVSDE